MHSEVRRLSSMSNGSELLTRVWSAPLRVDRVRLLI